MTLTRLTLDALRDHLLWAQDEAVDADTATESGDLWEASDKLTNAIHHIRVAYKTLFNEEMETKNG